MSLRLAPRIRRGFRLSLQFTLIPQLHVLIRHFTVKIDFYWLYRIVCINSENITFLNEIFVQNLVQCLFQKP